MGVSRRLMAIGAMAALVLCLQASDLAADAASPEVPIALSISAPGATSTQHVELSDLVVRQPVACAPDERSMGQDTATLASLGPIEVGSATPALTSGEATFTPAPGCSIQYADAAPSLSVSVQGPESKDVIVDASVTWPTSVVCEGSCEQASTLVAPLGAIRGRGGSAGLWGLLVAVVLGLIALGVAVAIEQRDRRIAHATLGARDVGL